MDEASRVLLACLARHSRVHSVANFATLALLHLDRYGESCVLVAYWR